MAGKWFGFDLGYDKTANASGKGYDAVQYNGNISGQSWRSAGDNVARQYQYTYDAANRLMKGNFEQNQGSGWAKSFNYDSWMGDGVTASTAYDLNGNIRKMQQWGWTASNAGEKIDDLTYTYYTVSNKLSAVNDAAATQTGLGDFTNKVSVASEYGYDSNGNMVTDLNKRLNGNVGNLVTSGAAITYNHLNLPVQITVKNEAGTANKGTIVYTYAANGSKLRKVVTEPGASVNGTTTTITTTTFYLGGQVYESKTYSPVPTGLANYSYQLQFFGHEEGRVRAVRATPQSNLTALVYDYMLKDHLGNVRMVLTEEEKLDIYPDLSFQGNSGSAEVNNQNAVWENANGLSLDVVSVRSTSPAILQNAPLAPAPNNFSLLVRSSTGKVGAGKLIKVMAGDRVHSQVQFYYPTPAGSGTGNGLGTLTGILASVITNSMGAGDLLKANSTTLTNGVGASNAAINFFNGQNSSAATNRPKAYLNVIFFDEQFNFDATSSYFEQVGMTNPYYITLAGGSARLANKNGYCYVYISNESNEMVYFDNLRLTHERGAMLEETHYYPFGLTMAGISSKAAGKLENKKMYQQYELNTDFDLNLYESFYRIHDPQIGRFLQIDPKPIYQMESPYSAMANNPISNVDILGDITHYYNSSGVLIESLDDGNEHATITVIKNRNLKTFQRKLEITLSTLGAMEAGDGKTSLTHAFAKFLGKFGVSYDTKEMFEYYDKNSNDKYKDDYYKVDDDKGPLYNEHMSVLKEENGFMRIVKETDNAGSPFESAHGLNDFGIGQEDIHTHPFASIGRRLITPDGSGPSQSNHGPSDHDKSRQYSWSGRPEEGKFNVVVSRDKVYLYSYSTGTIISVDRKNVPSKNPGEVK